MQLRTASTYSSMSSSRYTQRVIRRSFIRTRSLSSRSLNPSFIAVAIKRGTHGDHDPDSERPMSGGILSSWASQVRNSSKRFL